MAFWGIELKPGKPCVHHFDNDQGRLHLSQATLGSGTSSKKTIVQCNVGDNRPIYLCSLLPEKLENCTLNLEFEEDEEVTFSVIGPHSVHLSGFFFGETEDEGDSDPYEGHAIETESEPDDPLDYDTEDEDEDDFIDDDNDLDMYPSSPIRRSGVKIEEIVDDEMPTKENAASRQMKKNKNKKGETNKKENSGKELVVRSTSGTPILESEDEDGFPISFPGKKKTDSLASRLTTNETQDSNTGEEAQQKKDKDDFGHNRSLKRKIDVVGQDDEQSREIGESSDHLAQVDDVAPRNETKKKKRNKKKKTANKEAIKHDTDSKIGISKEENSSVMEQKAAAEMGNGLKPSTEKEIGESRDHLAQVDDVAPRNETKKKKRSKKKKTANKEAIKHDTDSKSGISKEENSSDMEQKPAAEMGNDLEPSTEKEKEREKKKKTQEGEVSSDAKQTITDKSGSKMEVEEKAEAKPSQVRSFPNGLIVEELAMGKPDGKKAVPGKKVSVHYIGKLKKNGKIFDSNIGRAPFKFRLGIGQVIKGWDVGVHGMHVGDKRRLTIPPAMGYGARGAGAAIPPNSSLVFDVELVEVS